MGGGSFGALAFGHYSSGGTAPAEVAALTNVLVVQVKASDVIVRVP